MTRLACAADCSGCWIGAAIRGEAQNQHRRLRAQQRQLPAAESGETAFNPFRSCLHIGSLATFVWGTAGCLHLSCLCSNTTQIPRNDLCLKQGNVAKFVSREEEGDIQLVTGAERTEHWSKVLQATVDMCQILPGLQVSDALKASLAKEHQAVVQFYEETQTEHVSSHTSFRAVITASPI